MREDKSEWGINFWGCCGRASWATFEIEYTHLTVHDTISGLLLKIDLRILNDRIRRGQSVETDIGVMESPWKSGLVIAMIDKLLLDGCLIDSVDALQICELEIHFVNLSLEVPPGAYIGTQFHSGGTGNSVNNMLQYSDSVFHLLCFRDQCISVINQYEHHLSNARIKKVSAKRSHEQLPRDDLAAKQESVRGTLHVRLRSFGQARICAWNPPRTFKTHPPSPPA
ncbi:hypothetical protein EDC94DRAFT_562851 [Helicostylum pulchrum]|nr:hypothetical protein EDC94DRAFT_562851 [Helicostylum pulchrum]